MNAKLRMQLVQRAAEVLQVAWQKYHAKLRASAYP